ncbi:MAG: site-specific DNA-methyltransferase [Firmicutes bacterium]|nr:site-specific DNA-methyltransferase [Bacillota bacterium]
MPRRPTAGTASPEKADNYRYPTADSLLRPDAGTQSQFKKRKQPVVYRYDSSLSPALDWDSQNPARELGEWLLGAIEEAAQLPPPHRFPAPKEFAGGRYRVHDLAEAVRMLKSLGKPFLNWAGKAERLSFDVPTLPLFVHERLSTMGIIETLKSHRKPGVSEQLSLLNLFGDPQHPVVDQVLRAYEYRDAWVNRMILGDSLVVMNSLLHYEGLGGQVQMVYMDPPYGVKFGSNFQPFVRKRDVKHNDDDDMTREPEMVKAYRDTWEMGLHSYLTYLRDRLLLARELLTPSGSIFVQINDENVHHVRELMDEVFGADNFVSQITFQTTSGFETSTIASLGDYLLWYARDRARIRAHKLFDEQPIVPGEGNARWVLLPDGSYRGVTAAEQRGEAQIPEGARLYKPDNLQSQGAAAEPQPFEFEGKTYYPGPNSHWKANYPAGMQRLADAGRIHVAMNSLQYRRFATDFSFTERGNIWTDTITGSFTDEKVYVVQTNVKVIERCVLMTTEPGDLVLDPTCGSGTTAYMAEKWGRRWITIDVSRVPLALARQRLLTATFPYYQLKDESRGPAGGFVYRRRQNRKGEEVGGIVPHITLESIANDEPPKEEVLVDRPEVDTGVTRVTGPFCVEATIPTPFSWEEEDLPQIAADSREQYGSFAGRMLEVLKKSPVIHLGGGKTITLENVRLPAKTLSLSAEAVVANGDRKPVALVFGPENGAVSERLAFEAAREAHAKGYHSLLVIGFAVEPNARKLINECEAVVGIPAVYVQATPDLMMGDLLKNMRSSQIFSVCGLPEITLRRAAAKPGDDKQVLYEVELLGLDVFDPVTMKPESLKGSGVPAWFLDTDYNGLCFHVCQAFFPKTGAWENLKKALKGTYDEGVWDHLAGTVSAPFETGEHKQVAAKVIDLRGNELTVVQRFEEAGA